MSSKTADDKGTWLDFEAIKTGAEVVVVLDHYGLLARMKLQGDELVGWCPFGTKTHGKKDSFNFNKKKKTFKCFACKQHGSILDFVAKYQGLHLRESAEILVQIMDGKAVCTRAPRDDAEESPDSIENPVSEASEQTREHPKLAETARDAPRAPPVDDPTTSAIEVIDFDSNPVMPFEQAMMQVVNVRRLASELVAVEKKFLISLHGLVAKYVSG